MLIFGLCFFLYFLKLSGTVGFKYYIKEDNHRSSRNARESISAPNNVFSECENQTKH